MTPRALRTLALALTTALSLFFFAAPPVAHAENPFKGLGGKIKKGAKEGGHAIKDGAKASGRAIKGAFKGGGAGARSGKKAGGRHKGGGGHHHARHARR